MAKFTKEDEKLCGVYKITNNINGKFYIGGTSESFRGRWNSHKSDCRKGKHHNPYLMASIRKYGVENFTFEILEVCSSCEVEEREQHYLDTNFGDYNISRFVGMGGNYPLTQEKCEEILNTYLACDDTHLQIAENLGVTADQVGRIISGGYGRYKIDPKLRADCLEKRRKKNYKIIDTKKPLEISKDYFGNTIKTIDGSSDESGIARIWFPDGTSYILASKNLIKGTRNAVSILISKNETLSNFSRHEVKHEILVLCAEEEFSKHKQYFLDKFNCPHQSDNAFNCMFDENVRKTHRESMKTAIKNRPESWRENVTNAAKKRIGKPLPKEHVEKLHKWMENPEKLQSFKNKLSEVNGIKVRCIELDTVFNSFRRAAEYIRQNGQKADHKGVAKACKNGKVYKGYHWEYVNQEIEAKSQSKHLKE